MKKDIFNECVEKVVQTFRIERKHLFKKSKVQEYVDARHLLYYLCSVRPMPLATINNYMNQNGYETSWSTIYRGVSSFENKMKQDADYKRLVRDIQNSITI
jgi:chromosomal replication initiation ATPase DnaA